MYIKYFIEDIKKNLARYWERYVKSTYTFILRARSAEKLTKR
jgi:hypothetical protein